MRHVRIGATLLAASLLGGCAVVTVAGAAAGAAIGVAGAVVGTGVRLGGKAVGAVVDTAVGDDDDVDEGGRGDD